MVQIFFAAGHPAFPSQYSYSKAGVAIYNVNCSGSESRLENCDIIRHSTSDLLCQDPATSAAGVVCTLTCTEFDLRTKNTTSMLIKGFYHVYEANVEICINGTYVAICDLGWDDMEAQMICNALGYSKPEYRMLVAKRVATLTDTYLTAYHRWGCSQWIYCYRFHWC